TSALRVVRPPAVVSCGVSFTAESESLSASPVLACLVAHGQMCDCQMAITCGLHTFLSFCTQVGWTRATVTPTLTMRAIHTDGETTWPNHALQRTRRERRGCNHCVPCAGSLSLGR